MPKKDPNTCKWFFKAKSYASVEKTRPHKGPSLISESTVGQRTQSYLCTLRWFASNAM